jgi:hypothetical protein
MALILIVGYTKVTPLIRSDVISHILTGISFMTKAEEDLARARSAPPSDPISPGPRDRIFLEDLFVEISSWLSKGADGPVTHMLKPCNPFLRRLTYQEVAKKYVREKFCEKRTQKILGQKILRNHLISF